MVNAIRTRDTMIVQGGVLFIAFILRWLIYVSIFSMHISIRELKPHLIKGGTHVF